MADGVRKWHSKGCGAREGGRCSCNAGYEAWVFSRRDGKKIRKTFSRGLRCEGPSEAGGQGMEEGEGRPNHPHECRHTFASLMIAAGVNQKALQTYMGHASVSITPRPLRPPDAGI